MEALQSTTEQRLEHALRNRNLEELHSLLRGRFGLRLEDERALWEDDRAMLVCLRDTVRLELLTVSASLNSHLLSSCLYGLLEALLGFRSVSTVSTVASAEPVAARSSDVHGILNDLLLTIVVLTEVALTMECHNNDDRKNKELMLSILLALLTVPLDRLDKRDVLPHADRVMAVLLQVSQNAHVLTETTLLVVWRCIGVTLEAEFTVGLLVPICCYIAV